MAVEEIMRALQDYADRGVFQSLSHHVIRGDKHEFRFVWLFAKPFVLIFQQRSSTLVFEELLPGVEKQSLMDLEFRRFLKERCSARLPEHRRIDSQLLGLMARNQKGSLSLRIKIQSRCDYAYVINKAINLVSDIFNDFLIQPECESYRRKNLGIPGE